MNSKPKTIVSFVDHPGSEIAHMAREVRINGQAVLIEKGSLVLDYGDDTPTRVMLTLLPTEIHFTRDTKED